MPVGERRAAPVPQRPSPPLAHAAEPTVVSPPLPPPTPTAARPAGRSAVSTTAPREPPRPPPGDGGWVRASVVGKRGQPPAVGGALRGRDDDAPTAAAHRRPSSSPALFPAGNAAIRARLLGPVAPLGDEAEHPRRRRALRPPPPLPGASRHKASTGCHRSDAHHLVRGPEPRDVIKGGGHRGGRVRGRQQEADPKPQRDHRCR